MRFNGAFCKMTKYMYSFDPALRSREKLSQVLGKLQLDGPVDSFSKMVLFIGSYRIIELVTKLLSGR